MIKVTLADQLNLNGIALKLSDMSSLMRDWKEAREDIFTNQFENELNPEDGRLRSLSARYLAFKRAVYPGRKKRELTSETVESHRIVASRIAIREEIGGKAEYLQGYLELPLLPEDWTDPTDRVLTKLAEDYLDSIL
jgi:hypothetical protein